jgi:hypothetical protein
VFFLAPEGFKADDVPCGPEYKIKPPLAPPDVLSMTNALSGMLVKAPERILRHGEDLLDCQMRSSFDKRDSLRREETYKWEVSVRFESFHRRNAQRVARLSCKQELYACLSLLSKFDCKYEGRPADRVQESFDKRDKKAQITFPLRHFYPLKVVK